MLLKRKIIDQILKYIDSDDILVLHGARQVGKSSILKYIQAELNQQNKLNLYIDLEDSRNLDILNGGVETFLTYLVDLGFGLGEDEQKSGKIYVFIDEIQYLDNPSSFLKLLADHHKNLKLIVSGSSSFAIKTKFKDSLVGRTLEFTVYNLSFEEFLTFKSVKQDLSNIKTSKIIQEISKLYYEYVYFGGYPKIVLANDLETKERYLQQIIDTYIRRDIANMSAVGNISKFNNLLKILANQSGQLLNITSVANICGLSRQTLENYLFLLENTYVIKLLTPFSQSRNVEISKAPKIFFYDTGLMHMLQFKALNKSIMGNNFETSVFVELAKKFGVENLNFWRTKSGNEIDFILNLKSGILPIEVKHNFSQFRLGSMQEFLKKYQIENYLVVGLEGEKSKKQIYPWEI